MADYFWGYLERKGEEILCHPAVHPAAFQGTSAIFLKVCSNIHFPHYWLFFNRLLIAADHWNRIIPIIPTQEADSTQHIGWILPLLLWQPGSHLLPSSKYLLYGEILSCQHDQKPKTSLFIQAQRTHPH